MTTSTARFAVRHLFLLGLAAVGLATVGCATAVGDDGDDALGRLDIAETCVTRLDATVAGGNAVQTILLADTVAEPPRSITNTNWEADALDDGVFPDAIAHDRTYSALGTWDAPAGADRACAVPDTAADDDGPAARIIRKCYKTCVYIGGYPVACTTVCVDYPDWWPMDWS